MYSFGQGASSSSYSHLLTSNSVLRYFSTRGQMLIRNAYNSYFNDTFVWAWQSPKELNSYSHYHVRLLYSQLSSVAFLSAHKSRTTIWVQCHHFHLLCRNAALSMVASSNASSLADAPSSAYFLISWLIWPKRLTFISWYSPRCRSFASGTRE